MNNSTQIAIIVLHYKNIEYTIDCMNSLLVANPFPDRIIIVNNELTNESRRILDSTFGDIKTVQILTPEKNLGYAGGNNRGIKYLMHEANLQMVVLLNNDTLVDPSFLLPLTKMLKQNSSAQIITPKILFPDRTTIWSTGELVFYPLLISIGQRGKRDTNQVKKKKRINSITGCAMAVKFDVFTKIGLFDENYFAYVEEVDFCKRAKDAGFTFSCCHDSVVVHRIAQSLGTSSPSQIYLKTRNRAYFIKKNIPYHFRIFSWVWFFLISLYWILKGNFSGKAHNYQAILKGIEDFLKGRMGPPNWKRIFPTT